MQKNNLDFRAPGLSSWERRAPPTTSPFDPQTHKVSYARPRGNSNLFRSWEKKPKLFAEWGNLHSQAELLCKGKERSTPAFLNFLPRLSNHWNMQPEHGCSHENRLPPIACRLLSLLANPGSFPFLAEPALLDHLFQSQNRKLANKGLCLFQQNLHCNFCLCFYDNYSPSPVLALSSSLLPALALRASQSACFKIWCKPESVFNLIPFISNIYILVSMGSHSG